MVAKADAELIHELVRSFYKLDLKSSNKVYDLDKVKPEVDKLGKHTLKGAKNMALARNQAKYYVSNNITAFRESYRNQTDLLKKAKIIYEQDRYNRIGNCYEMALLAAYYAAEMEELKGSVWLVTIDEVGDHVFCLLGPTKMPTWDSVVIMSKSNDITSWVVDPWANTCCTAADYFAKFMTKMAQWSSSGKQIVFEDVIHKKRNPWIHMAHYINGDSKTVR